MGTRHAVVAGHHLAAQAGFEILEAGGNAIDAGVAAGLALGVLHSDQVNIAGVAPMMIYLADKREIVTIDGLGTWPRSTRPEIFRTEYEDSIPNGILRTVVPAAPSAWITALKMYGTMSFKEVANAAIRFARNGFPMYAFMAQRLRDYEANYRRWPSNAAIYLPNGRPPEPGELFIQEDLGRTLQYMADEEAAAQKSGRDAGLDRARDAFYVGDIAKTILRFHAENGGWLTEADLADYQVNIGPPVRTQYAGINVYSCGPWCQGPALLEALNLLSGFDLRQMGHNSVRYIHTLTEAIKLAFSDREYYYGDPRFVDVPIAELLSADYTKVRRKDIRADCAWPELPPAGNPRRTRNCADYQAYPPTVLSEEFLPPLDTSQVCVVDRQGNAFSATPSDVSNDTPVVPGLGLCPSSRGSQSWANPRHPSCVAPGKRPRLTPNPGLAVCEGKLVMPFGTPGGDVQVQANLQVLLNIIVAHQEIEWVNMGCFRAEAACM